MRHFIECVIHSIPTVGRPLRQDDECGRAQRPGVSLPTGLVVRIPHQTGPPRKRLAGRDAAHRVGVHHSQGAVQEDEDRWLRPTGRAHTEQHLELRNALMGVRIRGDGEPRDGRAHQAGDSLPGAATVRVIPLARWNVNNLQACAVSPGPGHGLSQGGGEHLACAQGRAGEEQGDVGAAQEGRA